MKFELYRNGMKTLFKVWVGCFMLLCVNHARATHIYGGQLSYTHVSGNVYNIVLTLYGDCSATNSAFLPGQSPRVRLYRGTQFEQYLFLPEDSSQRKEVSPVCPEDVNNTACKSPTGTLPGAMRYVYTRTVTLPPSANWRIIFEGTINVDGGGGSQAGRSDNITNVSNVGQQLMFLEALLNNSNGNNSSPGYSSEPTPFFCINKQQQYNQGAIDADNDSLVFSLSPALINSLQTVTYVPPYNGAMPLAVAAGSFSFNAASGQLSFQPDRLQRSLVVNKVEEYRNGVLVGSSMREMTFIVLNNCDNTPPRGIVDTANIVGGAAKDNTINVCANTPELKFTIYPTDADSDNVVVAINNVPQGATASINTSSGQQSIDFSWNTQNVAKGSYHLFVTYTDDACPLFSSQTIAYTINVVDPINISHEVTQPTNCIFRQHVAIHIREGIPPRKVIIRSASGIVLSEHIDSTGLVLDSFKAGTYTVYAESEALQCKTEYSFTVEHSGTYPVPPLVEDIDHCPGDAVQEIRAEPVHGATINWYEFEGGRLSAAPTYNTDQVRTYNWLVSQQVGICESVKDTMTVTIHDFPNIRILNQPQRVCAGDAVYLSATGGVKYEWLPEDKVVYHNDSVYAHVRQPSTYIVKGYSEYDCPNIDSISYTDIEPCCTFSYPNAFTPNGDGLNDGWHPITYGNADFYLLSVYNRWGQRIFISSDPRARWDGTFNGKESEIGTYHYYLRAKCVTGHEENTKGSFILVR